MCDVRRAGGDREEKMTGRLDGGAEIEGKEGEVRYMRRMVIGEKPRSVKEKLEKMKKDLYSLMVSLQLT